MHLSLHAFMQLVIGRYNTPEKFLRHYEHNTLQYEKDIKLFWYWTGSWRHFPSPYVRMGYRMKQTRLGIRSKDLNKTLKVWSVLFSSHSGNFWTTIGLPRRRTFFLSYCEKLTQVKKIKESTVAQSTASNYDKRLYRQAGSSILRHLKVHESVRSQSGEEQNGQPPTHGIITCMGSKYLYLTGFRIHLWVTQENDPSVDAFVNKPSKTIVYEWLRPLEFFILDRERNIEKKGEMIFQPLNLTTNPSVWNTPAIHP